MMDMTIIQSAIAGLKTASDIAIGIGKLNTLAQVQEKSVELGQIIVAAQSATLNAYADQAAMIEEVRALKEEIVRVKAWEAQKQRYKLESCGPASVAYALKKYVANGEPPHLICTKCYEDGRKSILNPLYLADRHVVYSCPICKSQTPTGHRGEPQVSYAPE
ncbi:MAG: hypothetical protein HY849_03245 [Nitrosomonadales bacterium]|nr:hypothetical protein [Nitrosomonadales bacterium]